MTISLGIRFAYSIAPVHIGSNGLPHASHASTTHVSSSKPDIPSPQGGKHRHVHQVHVTTAVKIHPRRALAHINTERHIRLIAHPRGLGIGNPNAARPRIHGRHNPVVRTRTRHRPLLYRHPALPAVDRVIQEVTALARARPPRVRPRNCMNSCRLQELLPHLIDDEHVPLRHTLDDQAGLIDRRRGLHQRDTSDNRQIRGHMAVQLRLPIQQKPPVRPAHELKSLLHEKAIVRRPDHRRTRARRRRIKGQLDHAGNAIIRNHRPLHPVPTAESRTDAPPAHNANGVNLTKRHTQVYGHNVRIGGSPDRALQLRQRIYNHLCLRKTNR